MSIIINNTNDTKYQKDWKENIERLARVLDENKKKELTTLLTDRTKLEQEKQDLIKEINKLNSKKTSLINVFVYHRAAKDKLTELKNNPRPTDNFVGSGGNKYNWHGKTQTYYPTSYENNLYEGTVNGNKTKITEQEAIKLITRTIKAFEKVNESKFTAKSSSHASLTSATNNVKDGTILKEIQQFAKNGLKSNEIIGKLTDGSDHPDKGKPANHTWLNRLEYSFTNQYVADADILKDVSTTAFTYQSNEILDNNKLTNFFTFITAISKNGSVNPDFLTELNTDADILKDVENNTVWKIVPAQSSPFASSTDSNWNLEELGIKVADKTKTNLYLNDSHDKAVKFNITEGLKSWVELVNSFFVDSKNQTKLISSFTVADPYTQLLYDIKDNSHDTDWQLPEDIDDLQRIVDKLKINKLSSTYLNSTLMSEIDKKTEKRDDKQTEITPKDTEIDKLVKEILTKKREQLKKHSLEKGFKKDNANDNRRSVSELYNIQTLLCEIRYLENDGDATQPSSETAEKNALVEIKTIIDYGSKCRLVNYFHDLAYVSGSDSKYDIHQAITRIKAVKYTNSDGKEETICNNLEEFKKHFEEKDKFIKLDDWETQAQQAIETALGEKQDDSEKLSDWQTKLKALDSSLDETVITNTFKSNWNKVNKFKNIAQIEELLKKVLTDNDNKELKADFLTEIKKSDATLVDLKTLLGQEPKKIITYIARYEYNNLDDSADDEKEKKKTQKKRRIAKQLNKTKESELTDDELNDSLYQIEVGEITLDTKFYNADLSEITTETPTDNGNESKQEWYEKWGYAPIWGPILAVIGGFGLWWYNRKSKEGEVIEERDTNSDQENDHNNDE